MYPNGQFRIYDNTHLTHKSPKVANARRNLMDLISKETLEKDDTVIVVLRVKPADKTDHSNINNLEILDNCTLLCKPSNALSGSKCGRIRHDPVKFTFNHIFGPAITQEQLFNNCVLPQIENVLQGRSCLLFAYGTTNAGKTHTILGNVTQPGIIPRTLLTLFTSVAGKLGPNNMRYKPDKVSDVIILDDKPLEQEKRRKEFVMNCFSDIVQQDKGDYHMFLTPSGHADYMTFNAYKEMESMLKCIPLNVADEGFHYAIWVSFMEIYNDAIYDLLEPTTLHNKRTQLKLAYDKDSCSYVKGLQHICVQSAEEAYKVLLVGKKNLHMGSTSLNTCSSRSHCIYTVKVVKFEDKEEPEYAETSSFTLCDLAGAERQKKTLNVGSRLKESQNINGSLHVLGRCFETLRHNQLKKDTLRVPYRDSKLTQIFQRAFDGKHSDKIVMIVNINSSNQLVDETLHVLKASAIACQLITGCNIKPARTSRFSELIKSNPKGPIVWKNTFVGHTGTVKERLDVICETSDIQDMHELIENLQDELREEKNKNAVLEEQLRNEICDEFMKMIANSDTRWKSHMESTRALHKTHMDDMREFYEDKLEEYKEIINELNERLDDKEDDPKVGKEIFADEKLSYEVRELKQSLLDANLKNEFSSQQVEKLNSEVANLKQILRDKESFIEQRTGEICTNEIKLKADLKESQDTIDNLCKLLDEAKDECLNMAQDLEMQTQIAAELESENTDLKEIILHKDDVIEELEQRISEVDADHFKNIIDMKDGIIEDLENRLETVKLNLGQHLSDNERVLCRLETERDTLTDELNQLKAKLQDVNQENAGLLDKLNDLRKKVDFVNLNYQQLQLQYADQMNRNKELSEQIDILIKQHKSDGSMKISNYEILQTEYENKIKELTTKLQNKQEECDQLKSEVRDALAQYNENIKQQINHQKMPISNDVNKQKLEQQIEQMKDEIKMLRNNLNTCVCKHRTSGSVESSDTDESNKESIGVLKKTFQMREMKIENEQNVFTPQPKQYNLRRSRSENKSKCKTYKDFMDENYPVSSSRETLMKSAKKLASHKKKDFPDGDDVLYRPPLADCNSGRRRLFMDDLEDLDGVTELIEVNMDPIVQSPHTAIKNNMKKFKKRYAVNEQPDPYLPKTEEYAAYKIHSCVIRTRMHIDNTLNMDPVIHSTHTAIKNNMKKFKKLVN